jgi:hypothetical protein
MPIKIREADPGRDSAELIELFRAHLNQRFDRKRFQWLYLDSPAGQARAWLALDDRTGRSIGAGAAFPRFFLVNGRVQLAWVLGDFCIAEEYRTLGPALQLQRAILRSLQSQGPFLCYDFPSRSMMSIYRRMGMQELGDCVRFVKLLKVDHKIAQFVQKGMMADGISSLANWVLRMRITRTGRGGKLSLSVFCGDFDDEFTKFARNSVSHFAVRGLRDSAFLNWRYRRNPEIPYRVVAARRGTRLAGYAVIELQGIHGTLADMLTEDDEAVIPELLRYAETQLRDSGIERFNAPVLAGTPLEKHLRPAGFRAREKHPVVVCSDAAAPWHATAAAAKNWLLLQGDRDS